MRNFAVKQLIVAVAVFLYALPPVRAGERSAAALQQSFESSVHPIITAYCISCHGGDKPDGQFDLTTYSSMSAIEKDGRRWSRVPERLKNMQMPPKDADLLPKAEERQQVIAWFEAFRTYEINLHAGDPGLVLARRLSNAEYNYTVRDLTGVDLQPTKEFPADPTDTAGFDNSGETLVMSPELLNKYLKAARDVADHAFFTPAGFSFSPYPMLVETDQDKYCVSHILDIYHRQDTDYADYFHAAWRYKNRASLGQPKASLLNIAASFTSGGKVSAKYLKTVWSMLEEEPDAVGPLATLQTMWKALPVTADDDAGPVAQGCQRMRDYVVQFRKKVEPRFLNLPSNRSQGNGQGGSSVAQLLWRNVQYATHRMSYDRGQLQVEGQPMPPPLDVKNEPNAGSSFGPGRTVPVINQPGDPDLLVPAGQVEKYQSAFAKFCSVFPDRFYMEERGRNYFNTTEDRGRWLSAGFHSSMGYFRDDQPLHDLVLDDSQQKELDDCWTLFDFMAHATERLYLENAGGRRGANTLPPPVRGQNQNRNQGTDLPTTTPIVTNLSAPQAASQPVDQNQMTPLSVPKSVVAVIGANTAPSASLLAGVQISTTQVTATPQLPLEPLATADDRIDFTAEETIKKNEARFLATSVDEGSTQAGKAYYKWVNDTLRSMEKARVDAEPKQLQALLQFAARAYRRPLAEDEKADLLGYYNTIRKQDGLDHQAAMREMIVAVLMSPNTSFRVDLAQSDVVICPLTDYELASRLSYFLWSSIPDDELLTHAAAGDLHRPDVIVQQARRMLKDSRARALAVEFGANWLDIRRFTELNTVDRERFASFTTQLRDAMFEEPVHFLLDVFQNNGRILDLVYGDYTFVTPVLAKHYGFPIAIHGNAEEWTRFDGAGQFGRGGLLPMAVFLTKNAPGLRTSPVKRGNWVVKNVLGERIPPPPAIVPELPKDEAKSDLPLREMLARHRSDANCAACHARFDSMGLVFEGFGPIGEKRDKDLAGRAIDDSATFPGGFQGKGLAGLQAYIGNYRQKDFVDNFAGKLLSYALGRSPILSDELLVEQLNQKLAAADYRFDALVQGIVTSPQFLNKRGREELADR